MDKLESLTNTLSQITMYDIKSMYNQAKNVVLNVSEMEAKVREATNEDPWGASSTLMQEIAQGTFSFQHFNEIMPCIYARFMEKEAKQWRQIYKALQLLEYLVKHGSERVVDDARSHIATIKMLRNFHYIDEKGKDEGINVRNRSRELVELLSDVEKIRSERRKAKANKNKYVGVGNDGMSGMSFGSGGGRYGGFGSEALGYSGGSGSSYGNDYGSYSGGGGSSARASSFSDRRQVEEYDAGDDEIVTRAPGRSNSLRTAPGVSSRTTPVRQSTASTPAPAAPAAPVPNLLDLDDDAFGTPAPAPTAPSVAVNKALPKPSVGLDDDDFDDFQAAPVQAPVVAAAPVQAALTGGSAPLTAQAAPANRNLMNLLNATGPVQPQRPQQTPMGSGMGSFGMGGGMHRPTSSLSQPSQFSSPIQPQPGNVMFGGGAPLRPTTTNNSSFSSPAMQPSAGPTPAATAKPTGGSSFDDLWSMSLGGSSSKPATPVAGGKSIQDLQKEKANANLWGGLQQQKPTSNANAFGAFGSTPAASSNSSGGDDLLL